MSKIYNHGKNENSSDVTCDPINVINPYKSFSLLTHPGNTFNDRLIYDIPNTAFKPSNDPIDDRIRKNTLTIDWCKRLDTHLLVKYSYEKFKDSQQIEFYLFLSSLVQSKEAINFLTVITSTPKAIYTEYYSAIHDISSFLREAGEERYPCMIQVAAILMTLCKHRMLPTNPTWGFIRTAKLEVSYVFSSQIYTIKTEHIIVLQSSTNFQPQREDVSDKTYYNLFAHAVGLRDSKYSCIIEWLLINCGSYNKTKNKVTKPLFTQPLTTQSIGSVVFVEGMSDKMMGILLSNNRTYCSIILTDGVNTYIEPNVASALVTVAPPSRIIGSNIINVF